MSKLLNFISFWLFAGIGCLSAQSQERYVIGSAGFAFANAGIEIDATIGESVIFTETNNTAGLVFTQGFHQTYPLLSTNQLLLIFGNNKVTKASCPQAADASVELVLTNGVAPFTYQWVPDVGNTAIVNGLVAGEYTVFVTDGIGRTGSINLKIEAENQECELIFFSGFTPNGDGKNDQWNIGNLHLFPNNTVRIFNRWGDLVWAANGYDNSNKVFNGKGINNNDLPDGTYFYVVEVDNKKFKGWIELTR